MGWSIHALFWHHEDWLKYTRNIWMVYLELVPELFVIVKNNCQLVFLIHFVLPDLKHTVLDVKKFIYQKLAK